MGVVLMWGVRRIAGRRSSPIEPQSQRLVSTPTVLPLDYSIAAKRGIKDDKQNDSTFV